MAEIVGGRGEWEDGTPVDVAAVCGLSAVDVLDSVPAPLYGSGERWESYPHLTHDVRSTHTSYNVRSDEWIIIRANEARWASLRAKVPARTYGFLVQDLRWRAPTVWWVAEFTCGTSDEQSGGASQNLS